MSPDHSTSPAPRRARSRRDRRRLVPCAGLVAALLVAACGGQTDPSGDDEPADEVTTAATEAVDTTDAGSPTTLAPPTTAADPTTTIAPTTSAPTAAGFPATSDGAEWLVVRRLTTDDGYFGQPPEVPVVEVRSYQMRCADETCAAPEWEARLLSESVSTASTQVATVDGEIMSWAEATTAPCLSTSTGQVDGPPESEAVRSFGLAATDAGGSVWQGVYEERIRTAASAACAAEDVGYTADMWLFDPAAVGRGDEAIGTWYGEIGVTRGTERSVRACEPAEGCEVMLRQAIDDPGNPAGATRMFVDFPLTRDADGDWSGTAEYEESCVSGIDGSYLAEQGYLTTHEVRLTVYDLGEASTQRFVAEVNERKTGSAHPSLSPELAAACGSFDLSVRFVGVPIETPILTDWSKPAEVREPLPGG